MRCVRKETILLLFINATLHAHCRTVLKTQNISETDSLFSLKGYAWPACDCGPDSNCTLSGMFLQKKCTCKPGFWDVEGKCVDCECGPDTDCMWASRLKFEKLCLCKPGYSQKNSKCVACECGPDSNCTFSRWFKEKKCICQPGYWEVDGKCVETPCNSSPCQNGGKCTVSGKSFTCECEEPYSGKTCKTSPCTSDPCKNNATCEVEGKGFKCNCSKPWRGKTCENGPCDKQPCQNGGTCKVGKTGFICKCLAPFGGPRCENGPCTSNPCQNNGTCEVSEDSYRCSCNKLFKGTNCEIECDCGPYGACSLENGIKKCICDENYAEKNGKCEYCSCGENSKSCRYNVLGEKECNCSSAYAQNRGNCEECNCGPYGSCSLEYDRKRCNCKSFSVEKNGVCVVMESTTLEDTTATMTTVLPSTTQYCDCGEYSNFCRRNWKGVKICDCFPGYVENDGTCEDKRTSSKGTTDSTITSTIGSSTVQECDCGKSQNLDTLTGRVIKHATAVLNMPRSMEFGKM